MSAGEPLIQPCSHTARIEALRELPDLLAILRRHSDDSPSFYWEDRRRSEGLLALGSVHEIRCHGAGRFDEAGAQVDSVLGALQPDGQVSAELFSSVPPRFVGGFAFAPEFTDSVLWREFPPLRLFLPAQLWVIRDSSAWLVTTSACGGRAASSHATDSLPVKPRAGVVASAQGQRQRWRGRVERVLAMVEERRLEKIVLSRSQTSAAPLESVADRPDYSIAALERMRETRPTCVSFCLSAGDSRFFGSTPEILARVSGLRFETQALAGTAARGASSEEDDANARRLLACDKNLREQAAVTGGIKDSLAALVEDLSIPDKPEVLRLPEALHLHTPISGILRRPTSALELAGRVHPTPAVCGSPPDQAYDYLQREEGDRGWYAGAVGWLAANGDGSFAVALRSALADRQLGLTVWAGAGIVAGSQPDAEFEETELKMDAVRSALAGESQ